MAVRIISMRDDIEPGEVEINTTSRSAVPWQTGLSPFFVGPCDLYPGAGIAQAKNMENAWQFAKVYPEYADVDGEPLPSYWKWAQAGWKDTRAHRYPAGRGRAPLYSLWEGEQLDYIDARKRIYVPLYAEAVQRSVAFTKLKKLYNEGVDLALRDFDGYDHDETRETLSRVLNNPARKMGHAFVLKMLLTEDPSLQQCDMR